MNEKVNHPKTVNQSVVQQLPAASDRIRHRLHLNWFFLLSELTSPLAREHSFTRWEEKMVRGSMVELSKSERR